MKRTLTCSLLTLVVTASAALGAGPPAADRRLVDPSLTAAFLYTFAKFAEWPPEALPARATLRFCVDDPLVAEALEPLVVGRLIGEHPLVVLRVKRNADLRACHVLYAAGLDSRSAAALVSALGRAAVWSISDYDRFTVLGGVAHLFRDNDRLRFAINVESARRARLLISSRLLGLATIVREERKEPARADRD
jgi:hypothetical protein